MQKSSLSFNMIIPISWCIIISRTKFYVVVVHRLSLVFAHTYSGIVYNYWFKKHKIDVYKIPVYVAQVLQTYLLINFWFAKNYITCLWW